MSTENVMNRFREFMIDTQFDKENLSKNLKPKIEKCKHF